jgi:hypothetical protein
MNFNYNFKQHLYSLELVDCSLYRKCKRHSNNQYLVEELFEIQLALKV